MRFLIILSWGSGIAVYLNILVANWTIFIRRTSANKDVAIKLTFIKIQEYNVRLIDHYLKIFPIFLLVSSER